MPWVSISSVEEADAGVILGTLMGVTLLLQNISMSLWMATFSIQMRHQCWATFPQNQDVPLTPAEVMTVEQKLKNHRGTTLLSGSHR